MGIPFDWKNFARGIEQTGGMLQQYFMSEYQRKREQEDWKKQQDILLEKWGKQEDVRRKYEKEETDYQNAIKAFENLPELHNLSEAAKDPQNLEAKTDFLQVQASRAKIGQGVPLTEEERGALAPVAQKYPTIGNWLYGLNQKAAEIETNQQLAKKKEEELGAYRNLMISLQKEGLIERKEQREEGLLQKQEKGKETKLDKIDVRILDLEKEARDLQKNEKYRYLLAGAQTKKIREGKETRKFSKEDAIALRDYTNNLNKINKEITALKKQQANLLFGQGELGGEDTVKLKDGRIIKPGDVVTSKTGKRIKYLGKGIWEDAE